MKKRFNFDSRGANLLAGIFIVCAILMLLPMYLMGTLERLLLYYVLVLPLIFLIWYGLAKGTYITLDEEKKEVYGTIFFIPTRKTSLLKVVSLENKGSLAGTLNQIYMLVEDGRGGIEERGLCSKQGLKEGDFKLLIETVRSANPNIKIPESF